MSYCYWRRSDYLLKADFPAELLSHGEKQRLEIGMLVAQSPELLLSR